MKRWGIIGLGLALLFGTAAPAQAQWVHVREFKMAAILLTTGDTLLGAVRLHTSQGILELVGNDPVSVVPAAKVQLFAGAGEQFEQTLIKVSSLGRSLSSTRNQPEVALGDQPSSINQSSRAVGTYQPASHTYQNEPLRRPVGNSSWRGNSSLGASGKGPISVVIFRTCLIKLAEGGVGVLMFCEQLTDGPVMLVARQRLYTRLKTVFYLTRPKGDEQTAAELLRNHGSKFRLTSPDMARS